MKKQDMLKKNKEFRYVVSRGKSFAAPSLVLICAKSRTGTKFGLSVSAKLGNAVTRNRTKRIMRAGITPLMPYLKKDMAYMFVARRELIGKKSCFCNEVMKALLLKAGCIDEESC